MSLDLLSCVREQSARFGAVLRAVDPSTRVPSCPDWSAADLLWHLAEVHDFWARIVAGRVTDESELEALEAGAPARPDDPAQLHALYDRTTEALLDALAGASDDIPVWTWADDQDVAFVRRFQAHEALMHRVDAELAAGTLTPLPVELADDGIEVVVRYSMTWRPAGAPWAVSDAIGLLHSTDTGSRRFVQLGTWGGTAPDGTAREGAAVVLLDDLLDGATPTFTVSAPAADLDAFLWHRPGFGAVTVDGDRAHYERFAAQVAGGVQ